MVSLRVFYSARTGLIGSMHQSMEGLFQTQFTPVVLDEAKRNFQPLQARSEENHIALILQKLLNMEFVYSRTKVLPFVEKATGPPMNSILLLMKKIQHCCANHSTTAALGKQVHPCLQLDNLLPQDFTLLWQFWESTSISHPQLPYKEEKSLFSLCLYAASLWIPPKAAGR